MGNHVIRDRIWESKKLSRCSRDAALAYPWVFLVADDHGRFEYRPRVIWGKCFAARDDVSVKDVETWLGEYERHELLIRYAGGEFAYWTKFIGRPPSQRRESQCPDPKQFKDEPRTWLVSTIGETKLSPSDEPRQVLLSSEQIRAEQIRDKAEERLPASPVQTDFHGEGTEGKKPRSKRETWLTPYEQAWKERFGVEAEAPLGQIMAAFSKPGPKSLGHDELLARWKRWLAAAKTSKDANPTWFVQDLGRWAVKAPETPQKPRWDTPEAREREKKHFAALEARKAGQA